MDVNRLVIYVTLLGDSMTAEYYAVSDSAGGPSDLWSDGFSESSKVPSVVSEWLSEWLAQTTAERSLSTHPTSS